MTLRTVKEQYDEQRFRLYAQLRDLEAWHEAEMIKCPQRNAHNDEVWRYYQAEEEGEDYQECQACGAVFRERHP